MDEQLFKIIVIIALVKFIFTPPKSERDERDAPGMMGNGAFGTTRLQRPPPPPPPGAFGASNS